MTHDLKDIIEIYWSPQIATWFMHKQMLGVNADFPTSLSQKQASVLATNVSQMSRARCQGRYRAPSWRINCRKFRWTVMNCKVSISKTINFVTCGNSTKSTWYCRGQKFTKSIGKLYWASNFFFFLESASLRLIFSVKRTVVFFSFKNIHYLGYSFKVQSWQKQKQMVHFKFLPTPLLQNTVQF